MQSASTIRTPSTGILARTLAIALFATVASTAFAAGGNVTSISASPASVSVNDIVTMKLSITGGSYGVDCSASWALMDASNMQVKGGNNIRMQSDSNNYDYVVQFGVATPGVYTLVGKTGAPSSQTTSCQGMANATLTVVAKPTLGLANPVNPINRTNPIPVNPGNPGMVRK
ncbi:MAG: hypothetical protein V4858_15970 [Pseudomonadota bacterium]